MLKVPIHSTGRHLHGYTPTTVRPTERAAWACRMSKVRRVIAPLPARLAAARCRASSVRAPVNSAEIRCDITRDLVQLDHVHALPVQVELSPRISQSCVREEPGEVPPHFHAGVSAGDPHRIREQVAFTGFALRLVDVALEQGACVHVEAHRSRSSRRTWALDVEAAWRRAGRGLLPVAGPGEIHRSATPRSKFRAPGNGPITALGLPRSVMRMIVPRAAFSR